MSSENHFDIAFIPSSPDPCEFPKCLAAAPLPRFAKACCPPDPCASKPGSCCPFLPYPLFPSPCRETYPLCCRPHWDISPPKVPRFVNFSVASLACRSQKYNCWLANVGPKVDTNLYPSLFSSRIANCGGTFTKLQPPPELGPEIPYCTCHGGCY